MLPKIEWDYSGGSTYITLTCSNGNILKINSMTGDTVFNSFEPLNASGYLQTGNYISLQDSLTVFRIAAYDEEVAKLLEQAVILAKLKA